MENMLSLFKAFSDPARIRIVMALKGQELCLCNLEEILGLSPSTVSRHVSILKREGFLDSRKNGKWTYFSLLPLMEGSLKSEILRCISDSLEGDPAVRNDIMKAKELKKTEKERCV
ncbi:MAG: metalloregulator ArsR/SmtB family transcription factor [Synergistota bacterium]|nr:metalloregulator ArsR/SmtB family transcription factor [Synergistota bacterium]